MLTRSRRASADIWRASGKSGRLTTSQRHLRDVCRLEGIAQHSDIGRRIAVSLQDELIWLNRDALQSRSAYARQASSSPTYPALDIVSFRQEGKNEVARFARVDGETVETPRRFRHD